MEPAATQYTPLNSGNSDINKAYERLQENKGIDYNGKHTDFQRVAQYVKDEKQLSQLYKETFGAPKKAAESGYNSHASELEQAVSQAPVSRDFEVIGASHASGYDTRYSPQTAHSTPAKSAQRKPTLMQNLAKGAAAAALVIGMGYQAFTGGFGASPAYAQNNTPQNEKPAAAMQADTVQTEYVLPGTVGPLAPNQVELTQEQYSELKQKLGSEEMALTALQHQNDPQGFRPSSASPSSDGTRVVLVDGHVTNVAFDQKYSTWTYGEWYGLNKGYSLNNNVLTLSVDSPNAEQNDWIVVATKDGKLATVSPSNLENKVDFSNYGVNAARRFLGVGHYEQNGNTLSREQVLSLVNCDGVIADSSVTWVYDASIRFGNDRTYQAPSKPRQTGTPTHTTHKTPVYQAPPAAEVTTPSDECTPLPEFVRPPAVPQDNTTPNIAEMPVPQETLIIPEVPSTPTQTYNISMLLNSDGNIVAAILNGGIDVETHSYRDLSGRKGFFHGKELKIGLCDDDKMSGTDSHIKPKFEAERYGAGFVDPSWVGHQRLMDAQPITLNGSTLDEAVTDLHSRMGGSYGVVDVGSTKALVAQNYLNAGETFSGKCEEDCTQVTVPLGKSSDVSTVQLVGLAALAYGMIECGIPGTGGDGGAGSLDIVGGTQAGPAAGIGDAIHITTPGAAESLGDFIYGGVR